MHQTVLFEHTLCVCVCVHMSQEQLRPVVIVQRIADTPKLHPNVRWGNEWSCNVISESHE